jgi:nitrite reductase (NADH) small subunit
MTLALETTDLKVQLQLSDDWFTVCDLTVTRSPARPTSPAA